MLPLLETDLFEPFSGMIVGLLLRGAGLVLLELRRSDQLLAGGLDEFIGLTGFGWDKT